MTTVPEFCKITCSGANGCRILEPVTYDGRNLEKAHTRHTSGVNLCKHRACFESGLPAAFLAAISEGTIDLVAYTTEEKPEGRYVDRITWKLYSTNSAGQILPTGQTLHEYVK